MTTTTNQPSAAQLIRAAIAAAGRSPEVSRRFGISPTAVNNWTKAGRVPLGRIRPLCDMGHNIVTPAQILDAIARESEAAK